MNRRLDMAATLLETAAARLRLASWFEAAPARPAEAARCRDSARQDAGAAAMLLEHDAAERRERGE